MRMFVWHCLVVIVVGSCARVSWCAEETTSAAAPVARVAPAKPLKLEAEEPWEKTLEATLLAVEFQEAPLQDVCAYLAETLKMDFVLDRRGLEDVGLDESTPCTLNIGKQKASARVVLDLLLTPHELAWVPKDGALLITNRDRANRMLLTRVYKVGDLLPQIVAVAKGALAGDSPNQPSTPADAAGALPQNEPSAALQAQQQQPFVAQSLCDIIQQTIDQPSWDVAGGEGSLASFGELLIVKTSPANHRELRDLLNQMRAANPDFSQFPVRTSPVFAGKGGGFGCGGGSSN